MMMLSLSFKVVSVFAASGVLVNARCVYDKFVPSDIPLNKAVEDVLVEVFSIVRVDETDLQTLEDCEVFCRNQENSWCLATSEGGDGKVCRFYTDRVLLGLGPSNVNCTASLNDGCEIEQNSLFAMNGYVYKVFTLEGYGLREEEEIFPSFLTAQGGGICTVVRYENDTFGEGRAKIFGNYYTAADPAPLSWSLTQIDNEPENKQSFTDQGLVFRYFDAGTSRPARGLPISAVELSTVRIKDPRAGGSSVLTTYKLRRNRFEGIKECVVPPSLGGVADRQMKADDRFSYMTGNDGKYLNCVVSQDDNAFACTFDASPSVLWSLSKFDISDRKSILMVRRLCWRLFIQRRIGRNR